MDRRLSYLFTIILLLSVANAKSQLIPEGTYVGYEKMDVKKFAEGKRYWPGMSMSSTPQSVEDEIWFHQVTISIYGDSAIISKIPMVLKEGQLTYSDSVGGFYLYQASVRQAKDSSIRIFGHLKERKFTGLGHGGCGTPFYVYISYFNIHADGDKLVVETGNLGRLIYKKVAHCLQQSIAKSGADSNKHQQFFANHLQFQLTGFVRQVFGC